MTLTQQVYAQASLLAEELSPREQELLRLLCQSTTSALKTRLREGIEPADCKADFIAAASLFALAAMSSVQEEKLGTELKIGDVTMRRSGKDTASKCLYNQAELIITPYLCMRGQVVSS